MQRRGLGRKMRLLFNDVRREGRGRRSLETSVGIGVTGSKGRGEQHNYDGECEAAAHHGDAFSGIWPPKVLEMKRDGLE